MKRFCIALILCLVIALPALADTCPCEGGYAAGGLLNGVSTGSKWYLEDYAWYYFLTGEFGTEQGCLHGNIFENKECNVDVAANCTVTMVDCQKSGLWYIHDSNIGMNEGSKIVLSGSVMDASENNQFVMKNGSCIEIIDGSLLIDTVTMQGDAHILVYTGMVKELNDDLTIEDMMRSIVIAEGSYIDYQDESTIIVKRLSDKPAAPVAPAAPNVPATGDNSAVALWAALATFSAAGMIFISRRRAVK